VNLHRAWLAPLGSGNLLLELRSWHLTVGHVHGALPEPSGEEHRDFRSGCLTVPEIAPK